MQSCEVSIITPHFNRSDVVKNSILSVVNQTFENWELIVVDDFSDDVDQLELFISELGDPRIQLIKHTENLNGAQARNSGLSIAKGKYVAFLDSDDLWAPTKLETQLAKPLADNEIRYCKLRCYNSLTPDNIVFLPERGMRGGERLSSYLFSHNGIVQTSGLILPLAFAKQIMFNPKLRRHQDYDFLLRAESLGGQFVFSEKALVDYIWIGTETIAKKSISVQRSLDWLQEYKVYFETKDINGFLNKEVVATAIRTGKLPKLLGYGLRNLSFRENIKLYSNITKKFLSLSTNKLRRLIK
ncbi:glycosyltransferase family 2 protein [Thalassotalea euphylliae]|uniref:Glycosyltransferase n=1 Tax=Thalassotalea euphylliae TaxID=1655234 RepID=A0A3E0U1X2_9GAMM|nr:glycosyltransferase [Thalassotalea euphylliae]REL30215.1 glycosyltransferase [Thalassotalea euphylliae]